MDKLYRTIRCNDGEFPSATRFLMSLLRPRWLEAERKQRNKTMMDKHTQLL